MKKKIIFTLALLGLFTLLVGMKMYNKAPESISSLKTEFQLNASELLAAFENNEEEANEKYLDKVVEINGVVSKRELKNGVLTAYMETDSPLSNIIFQFENTNEEINEGETLTLKGICTGYLMDVVMVRSQKI